LAAHATSEEVGSPFRKLVQHTLSLVVTTAVTDPPASSVSHDVVVTGALEIGVALAGGGAEAAPGAGTGAAAGSVTLDATPPQPAKSKRASRAFMPGVSAGGDISTIDIFHM
jgi:hypothetical protein